MTRRFKRKLGIIAASQILLFFIYFALTDKTPTSISWKTVRNYKYTYDQKCATAGGFLNVLLSSFGDMIGWGDDSEEKSYTDKSSSRRDWGRNEVSVNSRTRWQTVPDQQRADTLQKSGIWPQKHVEMQPFQRIDGKRAWIMSAYFDHVAAQQGKPTVRVIGIFWIFLFRNLYCSISLRNSSILQVSGNLTHFPESYNLKHIAGFIECLLPVNVRPTHVFISYLQKSTVTNRLRIIYPGTFIRNFTVCYSVLHSGYKSTSQLIQSLEMNRMLGAEHFVVYNYSISPAVDQILQRYQQDGLVTVVPWPVPTWDVHYYGQMAALNDCSYRNRNISRFVVVVDTDECIIPKKNLNWMELLDSISAEEYDVSAFRHGEDPLGKGLKTIGSFEFRSSLFAVSTTPRWSELPSQFHFSVEEKNNIQQLKLFTLSQFWRSEEIYPPHIRTKYITRPELVYVMGIHFVQSFVSNLSAVTVDVNSALVHHYRSKSYGNVLDTSILKFKNQLYPRLIQQCQQFPSIFTFRVS